ncbi:transmembrane protein 45B-like [Dreissena polymorpha]|uniref:Transmembrane protein 45B n=1 Tax=Dreissena polymorpha TaxID=45954 RepID=A0A9D4QMP8_DREPO|nr:transmembrane protein 45B-like [Dreissena polymorpha]XP_052277379.1 transmembrane protein 45B-like [Dreissena polymorpha]KAH3835770.1 hypothetical protein DPMN_109132 [Dreissena polymorpha]
MGNFPGHALPGSFFIIFGLWWTIHMFNRFYLAKARNSKFRSSAIFNCPLLCGRLKEWPIEAYFKLICVSVGFYLEIKTGFSSDWRFVNIGNGQHATMFFFFGVNAIVDILVYFKWPLPPNMEYVSSILALLCEYLLFKFHLHGRTDLDVLLHTLLLHAIVACMVAFALELKYRDNILCALSRAYFMLLQGTWFWQIGWILYPPFESSFRWDKDDHEQMMIATMIFTWHAMVVLLTMLAIGGVLAFIHRKMNLYRKEDTFKFKPLIKPASNGDSVLQLHDESESDQDIEQTTALT